MIPLDYDFFTVMAGLDPAIQSERRARQMALDPRVKPAGDERR
jgi:hypothetical protein